MLYRRRNSYFLDEIFSFFAGSSRELAERKEGIISKKEYLTPSDDLCNVLNSGFSDEIIALDDFFNIIEHLLDLFCSGIVRGILTSTELISSSD